MSWDLKQAQATPLPSIYHYPRRPKTTFCPTVWSKDVPFPVTEPNTFTVKFLLSLLGLPGTLSGKPPRSGKTNVEVENPFAPVLSDMTEQHEHADRPTKLSKEAVHVPCSMAVWASKCCTKASCTMKTHEVKSETSSMICSGSPRNIMKHWRCFHSFFLPFWLLYSNYVMFKFVCCPKSQVLKAHKLPHWHMSSHIFLIEPGEKKTLITRFQFWNLATVCPRSLYNGETAFALY